MNSIMIVDTSSYPRCVFFKLLFFFVILKDQLKVRKTHKVKSVHPYTKSLFRRTCVEISRGGPFTEISRNVQEILRNNFLLK